MKIPGLSFSLKRALGVTAVKQKIARKTGIPMTKQGLERKVGKTLIDLIFKKIEMVSKKGNIHSHYVTAAVTSLPSSHPLIGSFRSQRDVLATVMA